MRPNGAAFMIISSLTFQACDFPLELQLFLSYLQHAFLDRVLANEADDLHRPGRERTPF